MSSPPDGLEGRPLEQPPARDDEHAGAARRVKGSLRRALPALDPTYGATPSSERQQRSGWCPSTWSVESTVYATSRSLSQTARFQLADRS